jgi:hypothetical protein
VFVCVYIYIHIYLCIGVDWSRARMEQAGYSRHMQSSLTKGLAVHEDAEEFDPTGIAFLAHLLLYLCYFLAYGSLKGCALTLLLHYFTTYLLLGLSRGRHAPKVRGCFGTRGGPSRQPTATKRSSD